MQVMKPACTSSGEAHSDRASPLIKANTQSWAAVQGCCAGAREGTPHLGAQRERLVQRAQHDGVPLAHKVQQAVQDAVVLDAHAPRRPLVQPAAPLHRVIALQQDAMVKVSASPGTEATLLAAHRETFHWHFGHWAGSEHLYI